MKSVLLLFPAIWAALFLPSQSSSLFEEYNALRAFKRAIYEDPLYKLSDWNQKDGNPCDWSSVTCSGDGNHVIALVLRNNLLIGIIPKEIGMLKSLTMLDLSTNTLTGSIPPEIGDLTSISKINFHSNGLTDWLPPELGNLKSLMELRLDRNSLGGSIPGSGSSSSNNINMYIDEDELVVNLKKYDAEIKWPDVMESWGSLTEGVLQLLKGTSIYIVGNSTEINQQVARELASGIECLNSQTGQFSYFYVINSKTSQARLRPCHLAQDNPLASTPASGIRCADAESLKLSTSATVSGSADPAN